MMHNMIESGYGIYPQNVQNARKGIISFTFLSFSVLWEGTND
jgi:hypothetical protein